MAHSGAVYPPGGPPPRINLLLTPVFTPPLDTEIGGERPTVQLVGVHLTGGVYSFDFTNLARWVSICRSSGIADLEIAHLFTQWGAKATPKIIADVDGVQKRLFGWNVPASSPAYRRFLEAFLPALIAELGRLGYSKDHLYFHISDEPGEGQPGSVPHRKKPGDRSAAGLPGDGRAEQL